MRTETFLIVFTAVFRLVCAFFFIVVVYIINAVSQVGVGGDNTQYD